MLGARRLIYVPADDERPDVPFPLRPGESWRGALADVFARMIDPRITSVSRSGAAGARSGLA